MTTRTRRTRKPARPSLPRPACIANNGANGQPEVPLWECPCRECTNLDWQALDFDGSDRGTLSTYRKRQFPEVYGEVQA